ncbi:MAG: hypothetical protein EG826_14275 [Deltaproteobacteria bacterium]|nr:hypothetical protein [Deltaproteobacteria bacterium]
MFSSVTTSRRRPRFRFIAVLTEDVDPAVLAGALQATMRRFPYYDVVLKNGFFWHFLEEAGQKITLQQDSLAHFQTLSPQGPLLHVGYEGRKINVEMAHVLSDGFGAVTLLKTLLVQYFRQKGVDVPFTHGALDVHEAPCPEEYEDGYKKYSRRNLKPPGRDTRAFRPESRPGGPARLEEIALATGIMSAGDVLAKARTHRVSVTEYLTAVLVQSLVLLQQENKPRSPLPVRVSVSANLRKFYPTRTLGNFSGFGNVGIDPGAGPYTFREIVEEVHHQCRLLLTEKSQNALISQNTAAEENVLVRMMPLFIKKRLAMLVLDKIASGMLSMDLTNMGTIDLPEAIQDKVERFDTVGGNLHFFRIECGVISYRDTLSVSFSRAIDQPLVERRFFDILTDHGIGVQREPQRDETGG